MTVTEFTPLSSTLGGALIGVAAVMLLALNGRIAGISGIIARLLPPYAGVDPIGAACILLGLIASSLLYQAATGVPFAQTVSDQAALMAVAGFLVGFGTATGGGCTSGHGVCGVAVTFIGDRLVMRRERPVLAERFYLPAGSIIDGRLIFGAALFGVGWGLSGLCPGPAIVSLPLLAKGTLIFVPAMLAGIAIARLRMQATASRSGPVAQPE
jgi:uncharacterized membrane protein YedE/YeeE